MLMRNFIILISILLFISCAAVGTKTIYSTNTRPSVQRIGYFTLGNIDTLSMIYPETSLAFDSTISKYANIYSLDIPMKIKYTEDSQINNDIISEICRQNNLDALLITDLRFIHTTYTAFFVPIVSNYDTEVEMQLYDQDGTLLYATMHNTYKGNSYMMSPSAEKTIHDGVKGAFVRIAKEIGWKVQTK